MFGAGMCVGYLLGRMSHSHQPKGFGREYKTLEWDQKEVIQYIKEHCNCTMGEISQNFKITKPEAQAMLTVLIRSGKVKRQKDANQIYRYYF